MLSVIIPSYKDPLLIKTIDSILDNFTTDIEIIAVLDGYWTHDIKNDPRVRYLHLGRNRGMRGAINAGIAVARGEYIMRTDEHCMFCKDFDRIILDNIEDNWIVTPRRYCLDPIKWEVMNDIPPVDYSKLVIQKINDNVSKWSGANWDRPERKEIMVDETMAMQGSCWLMKRSWWDKVIGELQSEGYGPHYGDSHEIIFKTWKASGKIILNKNAWYAHKHRSFPRTHNDGTIENPANKEAGWKYSLDFWRDYYEKEVKPKWKI